MDEIRLLIASWPHMDQVVVEMYHGDTYAGEGFLDDGTIRVRWRGTADVTMTIDEWLDLLRGIAGEYRVPSRAGSGSSATVKEIIELLIASWPDMDEVVTEMWHGETYAGEAFRKDGTIYVRWRDTADVTMTVVEWIDLMHWIRRQYDY